MLDRDETWKRVRSDYASRIEDLQAVADALEEATRDALAEVPHIDRVGFRVKSPESFATKVVDRRQDPPYTAPLREVEDQIAGRVLVFFRGDLEPVSARIHAEFRAVEESRREPKTETEFGYESDHFVFHVPPHLRPEAWSEREDVPATFELQVRTLFQHAWAEPQHDIGYKGADLAGEHKRELAWAAASAWGADQAIERVRRAIEQHEIKEAG